MMKTKLIVAEVARLQTVAEFLRIQLLLVIVIIAASVCVSRAATEITLRDKVETTKYVVRLGDVAEIVCHDGEQARELTSLPLMPAPVAGSRKFVRKREIEDLLTAHGFDLQALKIGGAAQVTVFGSGAAAPREGVSGTGAGLKIDRQAVLRAGRVEGTSAASAGLEIDNQGAEILNDGICTLISSYLKTKSAETGNCTVTCDVPPRHLASLSAATSRPVCSGGRAPWTGQQRFEISFATAAGVTKFSVHADVMPAATPVVVTTRAMARGEVVTAADVELQEIGYSPKAGDRRVIARSVDALVGMEVRQPIPAGGMVTMDALQLPIVVKRGDLVQVSSHSGGIRVRTTARSLQDRAKGQLLEVESLTTKERFDARVVGPGEAAIVALATPAVGEQSAPIETARR